jgi:hypothetical protein
MYTGIQKLMPHLLWVISMMNNTTKIFCDKIASNAYILSKMLIKSENVAALHDIRKPTDFISVNKQLKM